MVVAVEPEPTTAQQLLDNIELNGFGDRITVEQMAIGDSVGSVELNTSTTDNQATHALMESSHHGPEIRTVPMETVVDLTDQHPTPDLIRSLSKVPKRLFFEEWRRSKIHLH